MSVVVFRPDLSLLHSTLTSVGVAYDALRTARPRSGLTLYVVDNGGLPDIGLLLDTLRSRGIACEVISGHGNIGYGRGHNLAIAHASKRMNERTDENTSGQPMNAFHLVLNPDVEMDHDALVNAIDFFDAHPDAGLLTPRIVDDEGHLQYLCRRYPTLVDLFVRGFMPGSVRRLFARRLARYEMRDVINDRDTVWDPRIVTGCFMLFRTDVLKKLAGFDPRYFLYFEDYDLSLRAHDVTRVVYVPAVRVLHHGGGAARKGGAHIRMFVASAFRFFSRFGWKWL